MESLKGFVRRHGRLTRDAFVKAFRHPFLASPPPKKPARDEPEDLFPGAWVIPVKKRDGATLDPRIILGRAPEQDLWIDDGSVSKEHCAFTVDGALVQITDSNSTNGTTVNGFPLAAHAPRTLRSGDRIGIGERITFHFFFAGDLWDTLFGAKKGRSGQGEETR